MLSRLRKPEMMEVSEAVFRREMMPLCYVAKTEVESFLNLHDNRIAKYEFGHRTGKRVFRVVLPNGMKKTWCFTRHRHHHGLIWRLFHH